MGDGKTSVICEQGDMGLFGEQLSEPDQAKYDEAEKEESK